jgi:hypothetical protein
MTEAEAQARHLGCNKVAGSLEVRQFEFDTWHSMDTGLVRRNGGAMMQPQRSQVCARMFDAHDIQRRHWFTLGFALIRSNTVARKHVRPRM